MRSFLAISALLALSALVGAAGQSSNQNNASGSSNQSVTDAAQAPQQTAVPTAANPDKPKEKPKKIWTNEEMPSAGGISVVGNSAKPSSKKTTNVSANEKQVTALRERLRQLNNEMGDTDKKISELRNFRAENTSPSGGINMNHRYSNTPMEDQIKNLEDKKKQIQAQIEAVEDQARKNGIEPGQLR
jgi:hypothetical protein